MRWFTGLSLRIHSRCPADRSEDIQGREGCGLIIIIAAGRVQTLAEHHGGAIDGQLQTYSANKQEGGYSLWLRNVWMDNENIELLKL